MMDTARYFCAVLLLVTLPPAIIYWFVIHPFVAFWRKLGPAVALTIVGGSMLLIMALLYRIRASLLGADLGTNWGLIGVGAVLYVAAGFLTVLCRKHLTLRVLVGVPEIASREGRADPGQLLKEGIYAKVRHPRYVSVILGVAGWALFVNYLGTYIVLAATVVTIYLIVLLEEKELRKRFGDAYVSYSREVPRFIPRL